MGIPSQPQRGNPRILVAHRIDPHILAKVDYEAERCRRSRASMLEVLLEEAMANREHARAGRDKDELEKNSWY